MIKKICMLAISLAAVASSTLMAGGYESHWVAGASAGYAHRSSGFGLLNVTPLPQQVTPFAEAGKLRDDSFLYGVFAGIESRCKRWVVGFEYNIDWQTDSREAQYRAVLVSSSSLVPFLETRAEYEKGTVMGLSMRLGYQLTCWLTPYARIGVETSRDFLRVSLGQGLYDQIQNKVVEPARPFLYGEGSERSFALFLGAGAEMPLEKYLPNTTLRVEYNYHTRADGVGVRDFAHLAGAPNALTGFAYHAWSNPHSHTIRGSLAYNFM